MAMSTKTPTKFIEHITLFRVKGEVDPEKNATVVNNLNILSSVETALYLNAGPILKLRSPSHSYTHMSYMRFATEDHVREFNTHPIHLDVINKSRHLLEDVMILDWWHAAETTNISPGSVMRVTFLKLKEGLPEEEKDEVLRVIGGMKDKFPAIQELSFGENISPNQWAKGFSIGFVAVFKDAGELEKVYAEWEDEHKDEVRGIIEETMLIDYIVA